MRRWLLAAVLAAFSCLILLPVVAMAQGRPDGRDCQPYGLVVRMVEETFGQRAAFAAITREGVLIEFYVSDDKRWSGLVTTGDGCSDLFDQGIGWQAYPAADKPPAKSKKGK